LEFENVLGDRYRTTWLKVLNKNFPEHLENESEAARKRKKCNKKEIFYRGISLFICAILGDRKPHDRHYIYMQPGDDYLIRKDLMTPPHIHVSHFKEMLCIVEALPAGYMTKPLDAIALQLFYMLLKKKTGTNLSAQEIGSRQRCSKASPSF
jgi:hypothetical protein